jgi:broad specificity phosphatase PhoE
MDKYEDLERSLDPHRDQERAAAAAEVAARLRHRGVAVTGVDRPEDLVDLLSAVERFEAAVEAHGGDLMVDDLTSSRPDDQHFVVPRRRHGETSQAYIGRIDEATARLRHHPPQPD